LEDLLGFQASVVEGWNAQMALMKILQTVFYIIVFAEQSILKIF
jgi:hypothetical protein